MSMNDKQKLNYPVKYAILSIKTVFFSDCGFCESEQDFDTITNIVLKCYVVGERKEYLSDGSFKKKYEMFSNTSIRPLKNKRLTSDRKSVKSSPQSFAQRSFLPGGFQIFPV